MEVAETGAWTSCHKDEEVRADFDERMFAGDIGACWMVAFELLSTARNASDFCEQREEFEALPRVATSEAAWGAQQTGGGNSSGAGAVARSPRPTC